MNATPTPDAVLAALCAADYDLPKAAEALSLPLTRLLALLRTPEFRQPLEDLHALTRLLLDLRSAGAIARAISLLDSADAHTLDPAERRRIAAGLTRAANTATRLGGPQRAKKPTSAGPPPTAPAEPMVAPARSPRRWRLEELPSENPQGLPDALKHIYGRVWRAAFDFFVADPPRISSAEYNHIHDEWNKAQAAHVAAEPTAPAQAA